ncbi:MAG: aldo/keto reductase [Planctomycetes bacterium]|nr:aldo/keto reductase [Planctomycetota bacterium]
MNKKANPIDRRNFLKTVGAAGLGSVLAGCRQKKEQQEPNAVESDVPKTPVQDQVAQMPKRILGKTGVEIPALAFGTFQVDVDNQILLRRTLQLGVKFWDTAYNYGGGNSELGIGKFLTKNPDARKDIFLVTKASGAKTPDEIEERLQTSLKRMGTDHVDLYYGLHQCSNPAWMTDDVEQWAEAAKKRKLIKYFGITFHQNMPSVLAAASKCPWIDAVMFPYNFRSMQDAELQAAVESCHKAQIALIAMKVLGMGQKIETEADKKLVKQFMDRGFDAEQAKIKLVLEDQRFASVCVGMKNVKVLNANVAAVLDKSELTAADKVALAEYARSTCNGYCAGCSYICDSTLPDAPYVGDIMRYLMYYNGCGEHDEAKRLFAQIPATVRRKLPNMDYRLAEARCPRNLPIRDLITEAVTKLT